MELKDVLLLTFGISIIITPLAILLKAVIIDIFDIFKDRFLSKSKVHHQKTKRG